MLSPYEILPFLQHENRFVRDHAARYLKEIGDPSPATAEDVWTAIDRYGWQQAWDLLDALPNLPAGDGAVTRLLAAMAEVKDARLAPLLRRAAEVLSFDALQRRRDDLLSSNVLSDQTRQHLRSRLELSERSFDALWNETMELIDVQVGGAGEMHRWDRLIEALARHPQSCERAMTILNDDAADGDSEALAIRIVGTARYRPAAELLVGKLLSEALDISEHAFEALSRIGRDDVVQRVERAYRDGDAGQRYAAHVPLGRIALASAEETLLRLFAEEKSRSLRTVLADDLMQIISARAFPLVRDLVASGKYDSSDCDLETPLLAVSIMTAQELSGADELASRLEEEDRRMELRMQQIDQWMSKRQEGPADLSEPEWPDDYDPIAPPVTIRREEPKVGRNDPCPCGSGKKYKKCCLKA